MAPPGAVVVPEVVIRVLREHADRCFFKCVHGVSPFGFRTRNRHNEKTAAPIRSGGSLLAVEIFCCSGHSSRTSPEIFQASHRGISSSSSVGTLTRLARSQEFLMLNPPKHRVPATPSCKCVIKFNQSGSASQGTGSEGHWNRRLHGNRFLLLLSPLFLIAANLLMDITFSTRASLLGLH